MRLEDELFSYSGGGPPEAPPEVDPVAELLPPLLTVLPGLL